MAYLAAKGEERSIEIYGMDLAYMIASHYYSGLKQPSDLYYKADRIDKRSGKQIVNDLIKGLGGE